MDRNLDDQDELGILTVGGNYYLRRHNAKLTLDVLYAFDPVPVDNTGAGAYVGPWTISASILRPTPHATTRGQ